MKTSTLFLKNMLCFAIAISTFCLSAQTYITIDNTPQSNTLYDNLQDAVDNAPDNAIIYVQPSPTSYGNATIDRPLTIVGRSHSETSNVSTVGAISVFNSDVTLKGLNINSTVTIRDNDFTVATPDDYVTNIKVFECKINNIVAGYTNGNYGANGVEIQGCVINSFTQHNTGLNVLVTNNIITSSVSVYTPTELLLTKNIFRGYNIFYLYNYSGGEIVIIHDNMFIFTYTFSDTTISLNSGEFNINYCLTYNYGLTDTVFGGNGTWIINNTLENTNPLFTNVDSNVPGSFAGTSGTYNPATRLMDNLTLQGGSPALTAGGGNSELGVFANSFNYKNLGNPRGIPVMDILSWDGAAPAGGSITVDISAKAH